MDKIRVFLISSSEEKRKELNDGLAKTKDIAVAGTAGPDESVLEKIGQSEPDVVLLSAGGGEDDFVGLAQRLYVGARECPLLLILEQADFSSMQQAVKAGVRNILKWPVEQKELADNIRYLYNMETVRSRNKTDSGPAARLSKVLTVFGTKGGIGKTTVAVNLAAALSRMGKKVAVIDLDLQFGDVGLFFDIETRDSISELVQENDFDADKIRSYLQFHRSGVSVLCAPKSPEYAETVSGEHVKKIIAGLKPFYDYVIIDTPPIFNDTAITALECSHLVLFILTLDISTLRNAKISTGILESLHCMEKTKIVVNREVENIISLKDASKVVKAPVFCRIPSDWKTATMSLNKGVPFVLDAPGTKISAALYNLAKLTAGACSGGGGRE